MDTRERNCTLLDPKPSSLFLLSFFLSSCSWLRETQVTHSAPRFLSSCQQPNFALICRCVILRRNEGRLARLPSLARSSTHNEVTPDTIYPAREFQSKQQLAVFSSRCVGSDPLGKASNSLQRDPPDIPTQCCLDTLFGNFRHDVVLQQKCRKCQINAS